MVTVFYYWIMFMCGYCYANYQNKKRLEETDVE